MPSPPQLANLVSWYKADTGVFQDTGGTTPATTTGQSVALWQDQSGQGNHVLQATSANQPTYATGALNGLPSVNFVNANQQFLTTSGNATLGITTGNWWIVLVYITSGIWITRSSILSIGTYHPAIYIPSETGTRCVDYCPAGTDNDFADILSLNTAYLTEVTSTAGTVTAYHAVVGTAPAADAHTFAVGASITNAPLNVGTESHVASAHSFNGQICEVLIYKTALNSTNQASLESYLNVRYNAAYVAFMPWLFNSEDC